MKVLRRVLMLAVVVFLGTGGPVAADAVYHTERLPFVGESNSQFHGQVLNIHPNGPVNGAIERYQVVGAEPSTEYAVWIQVCDDGDFVDFLQTTELTTNRQGNGHGSFRLSAEALGPFHGLVLVIRWTLQTDGEVVYATPCTTVTID